MTDRNFVPVDKTPQGLIVTWYMGEEEVEVKACIIDVELCILDEKRYFVARWLEEHRQEFLDHVNEIVKPKKQLKRLRFYVDSYR